MAIKLPRLPANWLEQPAFFERAWNTAMTTIETSITNIQDILVQLGLVKITADGALALADSAINPDGTIKDDKVVTPSIIDNGVTKPYFVQTAVDVVLPDTVDTVIASLVVTKDIVDSDMQISSVVRMASSDDLRGDFTVKVNGGVIDTIPLFANGAGGTFKIPISILYRDTVTSTGSHTYTVNFTRNGGASTVTALAGSTLEVVEVKR